MRTILAIVGAIIFIGVSNVARANTCTAPGHPSCTVTCPAGCAALYYEPNGPCRTMCSGAAAANKSSSSVSSDIQGISKSDLKKILNRK